MSSISDKHITSSKNIDQNTSTDKNCTTFDWPFLFAQPSPSSLSLLNNHQTTTPCIVNSTASCLNGLSSFAQKSLPNIEMLNFPMNINFLPYFDDQQKLQQLQIQTKQNGKQCQPISMEHHTFANKMEEYLTGTNVNALNMNIFNGLQDINVWNNLRMLPDMLGYTNPPMRTSENTSSGLSIPDIQQLAFLHQIYSQLNTGQSSCSFNIDSISQSDKLHPEIKDANNNNNLPGNYHTNTISSSSQNVIIGSTDFNSKSLSTTPHLTNNENLILANQLLNSFYSVQNENQKQSQQQQQQQNNTYCSDNISNSFKYSNPIHLNSTMSSSTDKLYCPIGSTSQILLNNTMPVTNHINSFNDKTSSTSSANNNNNSNNNNNNNSLNYAEALMILMNAMYSNYKTNQTSASNEFTNGLHLPQTDIINYNMNNNQQQLINSSTMTNTCCLNTEEPKESFNDVLRFLSQCLSNSSNHNDKTLSHQQPTVASMNQPQKLTGLSCTKPPTSTTTTTKLSGRQKATANNNQPLNQSTTPTTTHRGRGRPPKLANAQYQAQSKQQQQHHKASHLTTNNEKQPQANNRGNPTVISDSISHPDHNSSQTKPELNLSSSKSEGIPHNHADMNDMKMFPNSISFNESKIEKESDSQEKKLYSTMPGKNESSVEETINDVLKSIANCKDDLATLASYLAYNTLGISSTRECCKEHTEVDDNVSRIVNMNTTTDSTCRLSSDRSNQYSACHDQSSSHVPIKSEWNLEDVKEIGMSGGALFLKAVGQDRHDQNNTQEVSNTTGNYFNQSATTEIKLNNCTLSAQCNLSTVVDSKACIPPQTGSQQEVTSFHDTNYSFCSSKESIISSITPEYSSFTSNNSIMDFNQLKTYPYNVFQILPKPDICTNTTRNQEVDVQNQHFHETTNEPTSHELYNSTAENILNSEKEYLKNFFIKFVQWQEHLQKEKDELLKKEEKHCKEMKIQELIEQEIKKPVEDLRLIDSKPIPKLDPIPANRMTRKMFGNCLMTIEFLHAFSDVLCIDPEMIPNMGELQSALIDRDPQCQRFLVYLMIGLLKLAVEDPGLPNSRLVTQLLGQRLNEIEFNEQTLSVLLRAFIISRNGYEDDMSDWLHPPMQFVHLTGEQQAALLAFICDELICSSRLISTEIDRTIERQSLLKREKWIIDSKIRRLRLLIAQKLTITGNFINHHTSIEYEKKSIDTESTSYQRNTSSIKVTSTPIINNSLSDDNDDDKDNNCKISELEIQIESLIRIIEQKQKELDQCSSKLSGLFLGQDRYYNNYYVLKYMGGIYIESDSDETTIPTTTECNHDSVTVEDNDIDNNLSKLPDSHIDYIVNEIRIRRELAQQRQLKLPISTANVYPCLNSHDHLNSEKLSLDTETHGTALNQTKQYDINSEIISNNIQLKNFDDLNNKDIAENMIDDVCSQSPNDVHSDNEKMVENSNDSCSSKDPSAVVKCESPTHICNNELNELSTEKHPEITLPKCPTELNSTKDDHVNYQSPIICSDETSQPLNSNDDHNLHKENSTESKNYSEFKVDICSEGIYDSSINIVHPENVNDVHCKISPPSVMNETMNNIDVHENEQSMEKDCHNKHVSDISSYKQETFADNTKVYTVGQPLDLSTKPLLSNQCFNKHLCHEIISNHSNSEIINDLDDLTLTKSVLLFMNHAGITPQTPSSSTPSSVDNKLYSDSLISIMNYCKYLLHSAITDELTHSKNVTNSDCSIGMKLPLKESLIKLKNIIPIEVKTEFLNDIKMTSEQNNCHSSTNHSHQQFDTDLLDCVNNELENRRIQTVKENLSCFKSHNEYRQSSWFQLVDMNKLKDLLNALTLRGVREKQLAKSIRRSKDLIELSMHMALKRNSDFEVKSLPSAKLNSRLMQTRTHHRRGRGGGRGHETTKIGFGHYNTTACGVNSLRAKSSSTFISSLSWEGINFNESKEIERAHLSTNDIFPSEILCSSDDGSSDTNNSRTVDMTSGYHSFPVTSPVDSFEIISSKYKVFDDKSLKGEDASIEYETFMSECQLLHDVEALEDKVIYASLQTKEWKISNKTSEDETISLIPRTAAKKSRFEYWPLELARNRLLDIERHLERRYLLPPFNSEIHLNIVPELETTTDMSSLPESCGNNTESTDTKLETEGNGNDLNCDDKYEVNTEESSILRTRHVINKPLNSNNSIDNNNVDASDFSHDTNHLDDDELTGTLSCDKTNNNTITQDLIDWRNNLNHASDVNTIRSCMNQLVLAIAWDKSIMKVLCQICRRDNNEACLLLCDGCDRGYHTYCFRPQLSNIPIGDWFCYDCLSKATSKHLCYICGGRSEIDESQPPQQQHQPIDNNHSSSSEMKQLAICYHCSRAVHTSCARPTFVRIPKRWYCSNCIFLKYIKTKDEHSSGQFSQKKSRRKRKIHEDANVDIDNSMMKRRKICSTLRLDHSCLNFYDSSSMSHFSNPSKKYQGWWRKVRKYRKTTENNDNGIITIAKSKTRKHRPRVHTDSEDKKRKPNPTEELNHYTLPRKPGRKPNYHLTALPTKPKRHYHRRSMLLVSKDKSSESQNSPPRGRRRCCRTLCQEITNNNDDKSSTIDSSESIQPLCQIDQPMKSNELEWCRRATEDLLNHEASWAFRKPVNLKQIPIYRKIIKHPMDLSTIWRKVQNPAAYATFSNWVNDVRLIFSNCEFFNEDDSEVGRAGHVMRAYFESHWSKFDENVNLNDHEVDDKKKQITTDIIPERFVPVCESSTETKHVNTASVQNSSDIDK
ncbi:unnamed protein product [Schistosoma turkestanicum]|nr:unnamed protein product [Schistosoma turkestanicum]CAH8513023.1 unnamed protein product [Schistosoma turkestanicum]